MLRCGIGGSDGSEPVEHSVVRIAALLLVLAASAGPSGASATEPLPSFNVDLAQSSVSGLSSGAYMAGQFHIAFSTTLVGAGIVAGGPYGCAEGQLPVALNRCMQTTLGAPDPARLHELAEELAGEGRIDPLTGLTGDRVYVFSGTEDETVTPPVVARAVDFYRLAGVPDADIEHVVDVAAGHGFITDDEGNACGVTRSPFINDCDYDQAGAILQHIHGALNAPASDLSGSLIEFDQAEFLADPAAHGMGRSGFAYVPASCAAGEPCRVHVAFHGCQQTTDRIGDAFLTGTGYNRWADANRLIILYPQAHETPSNPNACWDWWGYDHPQYMTRSGRQMAAVHAMLTRLGGGSEPPAPFCERHTGYNLGHWQAGRARVCGWWFLCAVGSGENLGFAYNSSMLYESPQGNFGTTPCSD
jgi:poly(3-hydroxybutyrate) depolymerase